MPSWVNLESLDVELRKEWQDRSGYRYYWKPRGSNIIMIISRIITIIMITPDEELAEPVLALSKEEADEVADDTWESESWWSSRSWWGRRRRQPSRWKGSKRCLPRKRTQCPRTQTLRGTQKCRDHGRCCRPRKGPGLRSESRSRALGMSSPQISVSPGMLCQQISSCVFSISDFYHAAPGWPLEGGWPKVPNTGLTTYLERGLFTPRELRFLPTPTEQRKKGKGQELLCV